MVNRLFVILTVLILFAGCKTEKTRTIHFPEIGWTLLLPVDMKLNDSAIDSKGMIIDSMWEKDGFNKKPRVELFWIKANRYNYCNVILYKDSSDLASWKKEKIADSREVYFDLIATAPDTRIIDSSLTVEKIDNVEFLKEYINYKKKRNDMVFSYQFSRLYKNYTVYINIRYNDEKIGKRYLKLLENSEFEP